MTHLLLQLLIIVLASQILGRLLEFVRQPPVIGEILAGILLGPSLLGALCPRIFLFIFPPDSLGVLEAVSQLGLLLFMFSVGIGTHADNWREQGGKALFVSNISMLVPFILGLLIAPSLYTLSPPGTPYSAFALFCGVSLSITAFPVLARIIHDRKLTNDPQARLALTCAAIGDVTAWAVLAGLVSYVRGENHTAFLWMLARSILGILILLKVVQPFLKNQFSKLSTRTQFVVALCLLFASALYFEWAGVHALFGAYLAGTIIPKTNSAHEAITSRIEPLSSLILLPAFFAVTGLRTEITLLHSAGLWGTFFGIMAIAVIGKLGGSACAARCCGLQWREATFVGILMNTRGLMELIVLNIGLELGLISRTLFAMMVLMALVTTVMTGPSLVWLKPRNHSTLP